MKSLKCVLFTCTFGELTYSGEFHPKWEGAADSE